MDIIYTEKHRLRAAKTELYGGELVPPFECPERMDFILEALKERPIGTLKEPNNYGDAIINQNHDADYLSFLDTARRNGGHWYEG